VSPWNSNQTSEEKPQSFAERRVGKKTTKEKTLKKKKNVGEKQTHMFSREGRKTPSVQEETRNGKIGGRVGEVKGEKKKEGETWSQKKKPKNFSLGSRPA